MVTERFATLFGIAAVVMMLALLVLVFFRAVPALWEIPLFIVAAVLFSIRLILRALIARRKRRSDSPSDPA